VHLIAEYCLTLSSSSSQKICVTSMNPFKDVTYK
jgi:hypothetical protein